MQQTRLVLLIIGCVVGVIFSCLAWLYWASDVKIDAYVERYAEALLKTSGLVIYTYAAIRFINRKVNMY